jgi:hypothetical protein
MPPHACLQGGWVFLRLPHQPQATPGPRLSGTLAPTVVTDVTSLLMLRILVPGRACGNQVDGKRAWKMRSAASQGLVPAPAAAACISRRRTAGPRESTTGSTRRDCYHLISSPPDMATRAEWHMRSRAAAPAARTRGRVQSPGDRPYGATPHHSLPPARLRSQSIPRLPH